MSDKLGPFLLGAIIIGVIMMMAETIFPQELEISNVSGFKRMHFQTIADVEKKGVLMVFQPKILTESR